MKKLLAVTVSATLLLPAAFSASPMRLTLEQAVDMAMRKNAIVRLAYLKVDENQAKADGMRANFFPKLTNSSYLLRLVDSQAITIPGGSLGYFPGLGAFPPVDTTIGQGRNLYEVADTKLGQPLTQLIRINQGHKIAKLDQGISEQNARRAENEVALKVHEAFFGLLSYKRQLQAARLEEQSAAEAMRDAQEAVASGKKLRVVEIGAHASLLEKKHHVLEMENQVSDLTLEFDDLLGLPLDADVELDALAPGVAESVESSAMREAALRQNAEVLAARQTVEKAQRAVTAAKSEYIPDVTAFGEHLYQNGVPFVARNNATAGLKMDWDVFDFGRKKAVVSERKIQLDQAEQELARIEKRVAIEVEKACRKVERAKQMLEVAAESFGLRQEALRLANDQKEAGLIVESERLTAEAACATAEADRLRADFGYRLARAELQRTIGERPNQY